MSSVSEDLYSLVEETLDCELLGLQITRNNEKIAGYGEQENYAHFF